MTALAVPPGFRTLLVNNPRQLSRSWYMWRFRFTKPKPIPPRLERSIESVRALGGIGQESKAIVKK